MKNKYFLFGILLTLILSGCISTRNPAWESRAKGTLRSIGSSQLAFQGISPDNSFGTFSDLSAEMYIAQGYSTANMIERYTLDWVAYASEPEIEKKPDDDEVEFADSLAVEDWEHEPYDRFTIIAYPRSGNHGLRTFGVTEDQVVRMYNPDNGNVEEDVLSWDPIL